MTANTAPNFPTGNPSRLNVNTGTTVTASPIVGDTSNS